jgi:hypothetical protein
VYGSAAFLQYSRDALHEGNQLRGKTTGNRDAIRIAVDVLVEEGFVAVEDGPNNSQLHRPNKPYRATDDPLSDTYIRRDHLAVLSEPKPLVSGPRSKTGGPGTTTQGDPLGSPRDHLGPPAKLMLINHSATAQHAASTMKPTAAAGAVVGARHDRHRVQHLLTPALRPTGQGHRPRRPELLPAPQRPVAAAHARPRTAATQAPEGDNAMNATGDHTTDRPAAHGWRCRAHHGNVVTWRGRGCVAYVHEQQQRQQATRAQGRRERALTDPYEQL